MQKNDGTTRYCLIYLALRGVHGPRPVRPLPDKQPTTYMKTIFLALSLGLAMSAMGQGRILQTVHACGPADIPAGYVAVGNVSN